MSAVMDRYVLSHKLGEGGMGVVYHATDLHTGKCVAFKQVKIAEMSATLEHEFRILASLRHPNIIRVWDSGFDQQQRPFFTMDLLKEALPITEAAAHLSLAARLYLLIQVFEAIAYLHQNGVIHCDLKPENIQVQADLHVKIVDFGLATPRPQVKGTASGTLAYIAPEVLMGKAATPAADYYALGVVAYEIFAGCHPFENDDSRVQLQNVIFQAPNLNRLHAPDSIKNLIHNLLIKDPDLRLQDAHEIITLLQSLSGNSAPVLQDA